MSYQNELQFLLRFFKNHKINTYFYQNESDISSFDLHIRQMLGHENEYLHLKELIIRQHLSNRIFKIEDQFQCIYYCIKLPENPSGELLMIGPYQKNQTTADTLHHYANIYALSPQKLKKLSDIFSIVPVVLDDTSIQTIIETFGETLWNGRKNFEFETLDQSLITLYSTKKCSLLIQQAIQRIDADLTADLSLHTMAKHLNSNASYLSAQFKKMTGTTYTEYVQKKRIEHALLLLNTTSLQIQTIAQYCGIPDLNYFSKLFKKYVNLSPTAYRKEIGNHET